MSGVPWSLHVCCVTHACPTPHGGGIVGLSKRGDPFKDSSATQHLLTLGVCPVPIHAPNPLITTFMCFCRMRFLILLFS